MAILHFNVSNVYRPNLVGQEYGLVSQQVRVNLVLLVSPGQVRLRVYRINTHLVHKPLNLFTARFQPLVSELHDKPVAA